MRIVGGSIFMRCMGGSTSTAIAIQLGRKDSESEVDANSTKGLSLGDEYAIVADSVTHTMPQMQQIRSHSADRGWVRLHTMHGRIHLHGDCHPMGKEGFRG